jgi:hypothetical protein
MASTRVWNLGRSGSWGMLILAIVCLPSAALVTRYLSYSHSSQVIGPSVTKAERDVPLRIEPILPDLVTIDAQQIVPVVKRLELDRPPSMGDALHVLRLFGVESFAVSPKNHEATKYLSILLSHEVRAAFFGAKPTLVDTRDGVRCRTYDRDEGTLANQTERQAHSDQFLAVMAEMGVSLSHPVTTDRGRRTVRAILDDSLANFDPKGREIEWSALAFALYLPPRRSWVDKFGRTHTLDELAAELIARRFGPEVACGGTHILYSLTALLRADQIEPVLSPVVRQAVRSYLEGIVRQLVKDQGPEGTWGLRWYEQREGEEKPTSNIAASDWAVVLTTGHHVEWMLLLPADLQPDPARFLRAARWLQLHLEKDAKTTLMDHYCPYSHAARVLVILSRTPSERRLDDRSLSRGASRNADSWIYLGRARPSCPCSGFFGGFSLQQSTHCIAPKRMDHDRFRGCIDANQGSAGKTCALLRDRLPGPPESGA